MLRGGILFAGKQGRRGAWSCCAKEDKQDGECGEECSSITGLMPVGAVRMVPYFDTLQRVLIVPAALRR
jgi:hypothetical protein